MKVSTAASVFSGVPLPESLTTLSPHPVSHRVFENNRHLHAFSSFFFLLTNVFPPSTPSVSTRSAFIVPPLMISYDTVTHDVLLKLLGRLDSVAWVRLQLYYISEGVTEIDSLSNRKYLTTQTLSKSVSKIKTMVS
jgi:hypothetical protein